jgi:cobyrinic acid a,c-diamide synthase
MLTGTRSGCGKTTVTLALLRAWQQGGLTLDSVKCGPDYIDPLFHRSLLGTSSGNLDLFFVPPDTACHLLRSRSQGSDLTVIEGAMGFYDGIALTSEASAWALSGATKTPAVLVVDARGAAASLCAEVEGFLHFQGKSGIRGVILNRVSPMLYPRLKELLQERCGVQVFGYLPPLPQCALESRHLGLLTPGEVSQLHTKLDILGENARKTIDLEGLLTLARSAPALNPPPLRLPPTVEGAPVVAVARDEAFCFYYEENLELLQALGAELRFFSPLGDSVLPPCDALYLGGGYPELYAGKLAGNTKLRAQVREAVDSGLPTLAECGGFLYLQRTLETNDGQQWPMCGVFPGRGYPTGKLGRFGYVTLTARRDNLLCRAGEELKGHEFHYWDVENPGGEFHAQKPRSERGWDCVHAWPSLYAGFPHLYFYANPAVARRFLLAAAGRKANL